MLARSSEPPLPSAALTYHGQGGATDEAEDEFVFSRLFSDNGASPLLHNGTFIEIGAHDGIVFSNSLFFERKLGGYTGDCLGAVQQISEVGFYLGTLAWL